MEIGSDFQKVKYLYSIMDHSGNLLSIPETKSDDRLYFEYSETEFIRSHYDSEGYVVVRGLVDPDVCDRFHCAFESEVKSSNSFIYRQQSADPERHVFTKHGFMLNAILNVHSVDPKLFPGFRSQGLDIVTSQRLQNVVRALLREPGKLVQTMYFEGNPATWPHQDTYYLDSEHLGGLVAAIVAVEDIKPGAGRFFVYPRSHLIDIAKNGGEFDVSFHHKRYKELIKRVIAERGLECRAPALAKGDVLFWNSKTIHGSLESPDSCFSRRSLTGHYIPESHRFLQFQSRIMRLKLATVNGMRVHYPKDMARVSTRVMLTLQTSFPKSFKVLKRLAIKVVTS
jgi:phytanoyl-CoA hydroxylase